MIKKVKKLLNVNHTPLIRFNRISKKMNTNVYGKIEINNPTGSHKDRETFEIISDVKKTGRDSVGCASTGNAAISLAAYSKMEDIVCHIFVSENISPQRLNLVRIFNPLIYKVTGGYEEALKESTNAMAEAGIYNANPGNCYPRIIGDSYIGREIAKEIQPDFVIVPTNNGTLFSGVWRGLKESKVNPTMIAATAKNTKIAESIKGFNRNEEPTFSNSLKESKGIIIEITDADIINASKLLFKEGIIAELASAVSIASIDKLKMGKNQTVCCLITGTGLKFPQDIVF